jgi:HEAT repeat protein
MASSGEVRFRDMVQPAKDSLAAMGETAAIWLSRKLNATDARERHTLAELFEKIGAVAVPHVVPYLDSSCEYMPKNAARCLGRIGDTSATLPLLPKLNHDLYAVRSQVATALGKIADPRATDELITRLDDEFGDTRAVATLICFLGDPFFGVRQSAQSALAGMGPPPIDELVGAIHRFDGIARYGAVVALGGSDDDRARYQLMSMLESEDPLIRGFAVEGLAAHPTDSVRIRVSELKRTESHPFVLAQIARLEKSGE